MRDFNDTQRGDDTTRSDMKDEASTRPLPVPAAPAANAIPPDLAFLFDPGEEPWAPLPTLVARPDVSPRTQTIHVTRDRTVGADEAFLASNGPDTLFENNSLANFTNNGIIWNETLDDWGVRTLNGLRWGLVTNNGDIVALTTTGLAVAFMDASFGQFHNHGHVVAISSHGSAKGFVTYDGDISVPFINTGTIEAWAGVGATAVTLENAGRFENSGTIRAVGQETSYGFQTSGYECQLVNTGLIESDPGSSDSIGVFLYWTGGALIENSGTIRGTTAIEADYQYTHSVETINIINAASGRIEGNIDLQGSEDLLTNYGVITGNVSLGSYGDVYTQTTTGQIEGWLDLGDGDDIANTGYGRQTIFGGSGNDIIHAGAGQDILRGGLGADMLDGGEGRDTADYRASAIGVTVDLLSGIAAGGDATGDVLISIEDLRGSACEDVLGGDDNSNTLTGLDGNDVLTGYGGNDTLNGGSGTDTAIYSGNRDDYSIITNGDGSQTITDLRSGQSDGSDTLIGIEILQFADVTLGGPRPASPPGISIHDVLFDQGDVPWAPLPTSVGSRPDGALTRAGYFIVEDFTLLPGEVVIASNGPTALFEGYLHPHFENNGLIWIENDTRDASAIVGTGWETITNNADIVALSRAGSAYGVDPSSWGILHNHGNVVAASAELDATGFQTYTSRGWNGVDTNYNTGVIEAWAGNAAFGVRMQNGGLFENSGTIRATGQTESIAYFTRYHAGNLINSGLIEATAGNGNSVGVYLYWAGDFQLDNSGTIRAATAVYSDYTYVNETTINNEASGRIEGNIELHQTIDVVFNEGVIIGNISLGDHSDYYAQNNGRLIGVLDMGSGDDIVYTGAGGQTILGGTGRDWISAGAGDDFINGGTDRDVLDGGEGQDFAVYDDAAEGVVVDLGAGTARGGGGDDTLINIENVLGSAYDDTLIGDSGSNVLRGIGGNDTLRGRGGDDVLEGGAGADTLDGGDGQDVADYRASTAGVTVDLTAGTGAYGEAEGDTLTDIEGVLGSNQADVLTGNASDNLLSGNRGDDTLTGRAGDDTLAGGAGADLLDGGSGTDLADYSDSSFGVRVDLVAGRGSGGDASGDRLNGIENVTGSRVNDVLLGDGFANALDGGDGDDRLVGAGGDDSLVGGKGNDRLEGDDGNDVLIGGDGDDRLLGGGQRDMLFGDAGDDELFGGSGGDRLDGGLGDDRLDGGIGNDRLLGGGGDDVLLGRDGDDRLEGEAGNDVLRGGDGSDRLIGGLGKDTLEGGDGDDMLSGDGGKDTLSGGDGDDRLDGGDQRDILYGDGGDDALFGDGGSDRLLGGLGDDSLDGGAGNDYLSGDDGEDTLDGGDGDDRLVGGTGDDILLGGDGDDRLEGEAGDDLLQGGDGNDRMFGGLGQDSLQGGAGDDVMFGDSGQDTLNGGDGNDQLYGGDHRDILFGGAGNDRLDGGSGADQLYGGEGDDRLDGGADTDTAIYSGNYADYTVTISGSTATVSGADGTDTLTSIELLQFDDQLVGLTLAPASEPAGLTGAMDLPDGFGKADTSPLPGLAWSDHALTPPDGAAADLLVRLTEDANMPVNSGVNPAPVPGDAMPLDVFDAPFQVDHIEAGATGLDPVEGWH